MLASLVMHAIICVACLIVIGLIVLFVYTIGSMV